MLFDGDEAALGEISSGYGRLYAGVLRGILDNDSDVEECANDVLTSAWNSIPPNRPKRFSSFPNVFKSKKTRSCKNCRGAEKS